MTDAESVLLGLLITLVSNTSQILAQLEQRASQAQVERVTVHRVDDLDGLLFAARDRLRSLLRNEPAVATLCYHYYRQRLSRLSEEITETVALERLSFFGTHSVSTDYLLQGFAGRPEDIFRGTQFLEDDEFFLAPVNRDFLRRMHKLVKTERVRAVRRLFIFETRSDISKEPHLTAMRLHASHPAYDFRVISKRDYETLLRDQTFSIERDMGIYGNFCVYFGQVNVLDQVKGFWQWSPERVSRMVQFFDLCWSSTQAFVPSEIKAQPKVRIEHLLQGNDSGPNPADGGMYAPIQRADVQGSGDRS